MSFQIDYKNRQLIPRLLPFETSNFLMLNNKTHQYIDKNDFEDRNYIKLVTEWNSDKSIITAIHLISYVTLHSSFSLPADVIPYIEKQWLNLNNVEQEIYSLYKSGSTEDNKCCVDKKPIIETIKELKNDKKAYSHDPILWCDLGYHYTILGQYKSAEKCYKVALGLNSMNRFVVQSVVRFFLHIDNKQYSLDILRNTPNIQNDTRLITSEIAISELLKKRSKFLKNGILLLQDDNISNLEKNELFAQVASIEFIHGKSSKGRKYIEKSISNVNENSLAQFEFLSSRFNINVELNSLNKKIPCKYEALTRNHLQSDQYQKAFENSTKWIDFQPFSTRPAIISSYISSTFLGKHTESIEILQKSLKFAPNDPTLLNNLAFSYTNLGKTIEAEEALKNIKIDLASQRDLDVIKATRGFIEIEKGNIDTGTKLYNEAINSFKNNNQYDAMSTCLYFLGNSLLKKKSIKEGTKAIQEASDISTKYKFRDIQYLVKQNFNTI